MLKTMRTCAEWNLLYKSTLNKIARLKTIVMRNKIFPIISTHNSYIQPKRNYKAVKKNQHSFNKNVNALRWIKFVQLIATQSQILNIINSIHFPPFA